MEDEGEICVFLASVVDNPQRMRRLEQMLQSAREQTDKPDYFCVSIYTPLVSGEALQKMFEGIAKHIRIARRKHPLPQFCQYRDLEKLFRERWYPDKVSTWVVFTDDDDLWHPHRIAKFRYGISFCTGEHHNLSGVVMTESTRQTNATCCLVDDWQGVDNGIKCGCTVDTAVRAEELTEYHYCTLRLTEFRRFLETFAFHVEHNRFTDMLLCNYVHSAGGPQRRHGTLPTRPGEWTYFYRDGRAEYPTVTSFSLARQSGDDDILNLEQLENPRMIKQTLINLRARAHEARLVDVLAKQARLLEKRRVREELAASYKHVLMPVPELANLRGIPEEPDVDARYTEYLSRYLWT